MPELTIKECAYHEAGHAVIAHRHGMRMTKRGIVIHREPVNGTLAATHFKSAMPNHMVWSCLQMADDEFRRGWVRRLFAEVEISQAGVLAQWNRPWDDVPSRVAPKLLVERVARESSEMASVNYMAMKRYDEMAVKPYGDGLFSSHRERMRRRRNLRRRGHPEDDVDDAVWLLMEARRAITGRYHVGPVDRFKVINAFQNGESQLIKVLHRERTWRAIEALARALIERRHGARCRMHDFV